MSLNTITEVSHFIQHEYYYSIFQVDDKTDFKHKTILCMPIMHCNKPKRVLGLFQLINKFDDLPFTKNDENFVQAFAIFCGMGINNVRMYEKTVLTMAKQQVTLEVLR